MLRVFNKAVYDVAFNECSQNIVEHEDDNEEQKKILPVYMMNHLVYSELMVQR